MSSIGFNFIQKKKDSVVLFYCPPCYFIHRYLVSRYLERNLELGRRWSIQSSSAVIRVGPVSQRPRHHCHSWRSWSKSRVGVPHLPAEPLHVALYILELTNTALQNGHGSAVIDTAVYSIRWGHKLAGLASPVDHPIVTSAAEGARRRLARPVQPKEPISEHMLLEIAERYNTPSASLLALRFLFILLIGYFGLFRINELLSHVTFRLAIRICPFSLAVVRMTSIATVIPVY